MRGFSGIIAAIIIILMVAVTIGSIGLTWKWGNGIEKKAEAQHELYSMANSLEAARLYAYVSLRYSAYQAVYDNGMAGGFGGVPASITYNGKKYPLWPDAGGFAPTKENVIKAVEKLAKSGLMKYVETPYDFAGRAVAMPTDYSVSVEEKSGGLKVSAAAKGKFRAESIDPAGKQHTVLEKIADLSMEMGTLYGEIIDRSGQFVAGKELETTVNDYLSSLQTSYSACSAAEPSAEQVLQEATGMRFEAEVKDEAWSGIAAAAAALAASKGTDKKIKWEITLAGTGADNVFTEVSCAKASENCQPAGEPKMDNYDCSISYTADIEAAITVTDLTAKYPVAVPDGPASKLSFENVALLFGERFTAVWPEPAPSDA